MQSARCFIENCSQKVLKPTEHIHEYECVFIYLRIFPPRRYRLLTLILAFGVWPELDAKIFTGAKLLLHRMNSLILLFHSVHHVCISFRGKKTHSLCQLIGSWQKMLLKLRVSQLPHMYSWIGNEILFGQLWLVASRHEYECEWNTCTAKKEPKIWKMILCIDQNEDTRTLTLKPHVYIFSFACLNDRSWNSKENVEMNHELLSVEDL